MKIKQKWLNAILHISSVIYRKKSKTLAAGVLKSIGLFLQIIVLEILLGIISLPFYIFIVSDKNFDKNDKQIKMYRLRRRVTIGTLLVFLIYYSGEFLLGAWGLFGNPEVSKAALTVNMTLSGSYTGNGSDDRAITGLGFQPDVVIIKRSDSFSNYAIIRTSTMVGDNAKPISGSTALTANLIQSLDSNGFTIGTSTEVNASGGTYQWVAFKAASGKMKVGSYTGTYNGSTGAPKSVTGLGFSPDYMMILPASAVFPVHRTSGMPASSAFLFESDTGNTNRITSFDSDGFTVGTSSTTNTSGTTYHYIAWDADSSMAVGSYSGDSNDNRNITSVGFQPEYVIIAPNSSVNDVHRPASLAGDNAIPFYNGYSSSNLIQSLTSNGFQVGSSNQVNASGTTYYYAAFLRSVPPTFTQSAYRFYENNDGLSPGAVMADTNAAPTLSSPGDAFRLRMLMHVATDQLVQNGETFKLQYVDKGAGTCASPSGSSPASYTDVTTSTLISYRDNQSITDGTSISSGGTDPDHSAHTINPQTYEEANNFTNAQSAIASDTDGLWDFALYDNGAAENATYCFRIVRSDSSTVLDTYSVYPEITTAVADNIAPNITNITSSSANGSYPTSASISIQVEFDEVVRVVGVPTLTLETGVTDAVAQYASGDNSNTLTFTYIVGGGENSSDLDYAGINALTLDDATIRDAADNNANLTLPTPGQDGSLSANKAIVIDTVVPNILDVTSSSPDDVYNINDIISIQIEFSEAVTVGGVGTPTLTLETGSSDATASYTGGSGTDTLTFTYTIESGQDASDLDYVDVNSLTLNGATIKDGAGNDATLTLQLPGDSGSLGANKNIVVNTDVTAPTITNVTSTKENGTYGTDEAIPIVIEWSEAVEVTGTPQLTIETGDSDAIANYTSGNGTNTLIFTYTVSSGHASADLDYVSENSLSLAGGTIADGADNNATLTLPVPGMGPSLGVNKDIVIDTTPPDTTAPTIMNITSPNANRAYNEGGTITIQLEMSEVVNVSGGPRLLLETGDSDTYATYTSGSGTSTLTFSYTVGAGHNNTDLDYVGSDSLDLNGGTIQDDAANPLENILPSPGSEFSLSDNKDIAVDTTSPTIINVTSPQNDGSYGVGENILVRVEFSESVIVVGTPQIQLETGATDVLVNYTSGSGSDTLTFSYTVEEGHNNADLDYISANALTLSGATIRDEAANDATLTLPEPGQSGSLGSNKSFAVDTTDPTVVNVTSATADGTYKTDDEIIIQVEFSEAVVVSGSPQIALETGSSNGVADYSSGSGTNTLNFSYTVSSGHSANDVDYVNETALALNSGTIQDSIGNNATLTLPTPGGANSLAANKNIIIDAIAPSTSVISLSDATTSSITVSWTAPGDDEDSGTADSYDIRYSTNPITSGNFDAANGAGYGDSPAAAGQSEEAIIGGLNDGTTYYFALKTIDEAGNTSEISNVPSTTTESEPPPPPVDTTPPTVESVSSTKTNGDYGIGENIIIQVNFSENIDVTGAPKLLLETGATDRQATYSGGSGTSTLTFSYTIASGDSSSDLDYINTSALTLNGGAIADSSENNATLTLPTPGASGSLGANKNIGVDGIAPSAAVLTLSSPTTSSITVNWIATGDNQDTGTAVTYDLRYSTSIINSGNFNAASDAGYNDPPQVAGETEEFVVTGLVEGTTYYFALKVSDDVGNTSNISNVPHESTESDGVTPPSPPPTPPTPPPTPPSTSSSSSRNGNRKDGPSGGGNAGSPRQAPTPPPSFKSNPATPPPSTSNPDQYFVDTTTHWAKEYIKELKNKCNISGYTSLDYPGEHEFKPDNPISRAELTTLLVKCSDGVIAARPSKQTFKDVPTAHWAASYIQKAVEKGIITTANANFRPNAPVTLAEALKMIFLTRFNKNIVETSAAPAECKDVKAKDWFAPYLGYGVKSGIITRYKTTGRCDPLSFISRAEVAKILTLNTGENQHGF